MPGETETQLLLKFGLPLVYRLAGAGKGEKETIQEVKAAIENIGSGDVEVGERLLKANEKQTESIVDSLFGLITNIPNAFGKLIGAFFGLFK